MTNHPFIRALIRAFWKVRGKSTYDTMRLYSWFVFWIVEGAWVRILPGRLGQVALTARRKRFSRIAQREKVYLKEFGGYHDLFFYFAHRGDFDMVWFQWRPGEIGLQIGANRGGYSLLASRLIGPQGLCIAIEPNPAAYLDLLELIALNKASNVIALPVACGSHEGWVDMEQPPGEWEDVLVRVKTLEDPQAVTLSRVRLYRLSKIVEGLGLERCDFVIIDVEGYEGEVLRGADAVLRQFRPRLYIEIHDTWDEIEGILRAYGYVVRAWKGSRPGRGHVWAMPE
jgi:FkbM family methyltransferase